MFQSAIHNDTLCFELFPPVPSLRTSFSDSAESVAKPVFLPLLSLPLPDLTRILCLLHAAVRELFLAFKQNHLLASAGLRDRRATILLEHVLRFSFFILFFTLIGL
jgi:hypothetical protein